MVDRVEDLGFGGLFGVEPVQLAQPVPRFLRDFEENLIKFYEFYRKMETFFWKIILQNFWGDKFKFSENAQMLPKIKAAKTPECIWMYPNMSEQLRKGSYWSKCYQNLLKVLETSTETLKILK